MTLYIILFFIALCTGMALSVYTFGTGGKRKHIFQNIYFSVEDTDGVITGEYAVKLQPEDKTVEGIIIDRSVLSLEDTYDTDNADVLKPKTGNQVKFEVVNFNGAGSLRVIITDDGGAGMWKLSTETDWHHSGTSITTKAGLVTIIYKDIEGKTLPTQTSATVKDGETVEVNAVYTSAG